MSNRNISRLLGFDDNWLGVLKNRNIDKYNYLSSFHSDRYTSLLIAKNRLEGIIVSVEEALQDKTKAKKIKSLKLYDSHSSLQLEILKDSLYSVREQVLSMRYEFILKLERIKDIL